MRGFDELPNEKGKIGLDTHLIDDREFSLFLRDPDIRPLEEYQIVKRKDGTDVIHLADINFSR